jgi:glycerate kinase
MTILIAPDKFKGSLSGSQVCEAIRNGIHAIDASINCVLLPLADGGEGTAELLTRYDGGTMKEVSARDPLFREISSGFGISRDGKTAFLEMAKASGLQLIKKDERDPRLTSTVGTGDLIRKALALRVEKIVMGIGGSATNDAGMGMAESLGVIFYDRAGNQLKPIGKNLVHVDTIDATNVDPELKKVDVTIFCDVDNPLHGTRGAAYVFAPQKGADPDTVRELDNGLQHFEKILEKTFGRKVNFPGAGAGGGLPAMISALANVTIRAGMEFIIEFTRLDELVRDADIIITGEGKIDEQTLYGKVVKGVADLGLKYRKPTVAVAGKCELNEETVLKTGISHLITLSTGNIGEEESIKNAYSLLKQRIQQELPSLIAAVRS